MTQQNLYAFFATVLFIFVLIHLLNEILGKVNIVSRCIICNSHVRPNWHKHFEFLIFKNLRIHLLESLLFQIASIQFDWILVLVIINNRFAFFHELFDFGTIVALWQLFDSNILLEIALVIDEAELLEETFTESLKKKIGLIKRNTINFTI